VKIGVNAPMPSVIPGNSGTAPDLFSVETHTSGREHERSKGVLEIDEIDEIVDTPM
jgi:hypothetical protein